MNWGRFTSGVGLSLVLVAVSTSICSADLGQKVGKQHAAYAMALAADGYKFGSNDLSWLEDYEESCQGLESQLPPPEPDKRKQLQDYLDLFCKPWAQLWDPVLEKCSVEHAPHWCDDEDTVFEHLTLDSYYAALQSALKASSDHLQRFNLMDIMVNVLDAHVATELPVSRLEQLYVVAIGEYLRTAAPDEVLDVGRHFQHTWLGLFPLVGKQFAGYAQAGRASSPQQTRELLEMSEKRYAE